MANADQPDGFARVERPLQACVWEGAIISHEHRAWIGKMLADSPDAQGYLDDILPDGSY